MSEESESIPSDFDTEEVTASAISPLPGKSKARYETVYTRFDQWCGERKINEDLILEYFQEKFETQKASTMWCHYSMLKSMISLQKNIDISKFTGLIAFLKNKSNGYKAIKSRVFSKKDFGTFLKEANDDRYLMLKVAMIIGVAGACRREELTYLLKENVRDEGNFILVCIPGSKTKTPKEFVITAGNFENINLIEIIRKYINLRPAETEHQRFFLGYRQGKCIKQPVGINTVGAMPKNIALFLGLPNPEQYTGHCFKRSSKSLLADTGGHILTLKRHGGWKSVPIGYVDDSIDVKEEDIAMKLLRQDESHYYDENNVTATSSSHQVSENNINFIGKNSTTSNVKEEIQDIEDEELVENNIMKIPCPKELGPCDIIQGIFKPYCPTMLKIVGIKAVSSNNKKYKCRWIVDYVIKDANNYPAGPNRLYNSPKFRDEILRKIESNKPRNTNIIDHYPLMSEGDQYWEFHYGIFCSCGENTAFSIGDIDTTNDNNY